LIGFDFEAKYFAVKELESFRRKH